MQKIKACMLVTLCTITSLSYANEIPNINFGNVAEKLEYDLATWKTRNNAVKSIHIFTNLTFVTLIALNIAGDYTNNQIIKSLSPSKQYKETFGAVSTFTFFASIYTSSQVSELEKAVQEYIKRSEQQNK